MFFGAPASRISSNYLLHHGGIDHVFANGSGCPLADFGELIQQPGLIVDLNVDYSKRRFAAQAQIDAELKAALGG